MWSFLSSLLDIVLPRKERVVRIDTYSLTELPLEPQEHELCGVGITTLTSYRTQEIDDLIRALKYDQASHAASLLAGVLAEYLREEIASLKTFSAKPVVLIPVPLHSSRVRDRGFNQVEVILSALPEEFRDGTLSRVVTGALVRTRATAQQTRLSRTERLRNVHDAFALQKKERIQNVHVVLIDDVTTTGATITSAGKPLREHGIAHSLLAIARA